LGSEGVWLRHGGLRVIYQWDKAEDTVIISHIGPRGDIYK
jgi:mRNA-degrading endonuclease RelE of RelBE toxin-antitoxin system